jgi:predicted O-methyltransferase YrrM
MSRRASLPGADALFGSDRPAPRPAAPDVDQEIDARVLAEVRRLTAFEGDALLDARERAEGATTLPSPEVGSLLRWLVHTCGTKAAIEVGAAAGVTGLWLLAALPAGGVLTSIEADPHTHGLAQEAFKAAHGPARVRGILGEPDTVLSRLSDDSYDLLLLQSSAGGLPTQLEHARRLLRTGGLLLARGVLRPGEHADAQARFVHDLAEDPGFDVTVLPVDDGIVVATHVEVDEDA